MQILPVINRYLLSSGQLSSTNLPHVHASLLPATHPHKGIQMPFAHSTLPTIAVLNLVLEKAMAPHSSDLAWRIPGTEEPGGLPSMGSHRVGHD